ncbi:MAG: acyltransferase [Clostridia bacterium]
MIKYNKNTNVRESNFELLRILAMFLITFFHFIGHGGFLANSIGVNHTLFKITETIFSISVNLFVMISAYFLATKKIKIKKIIYLWLTVVFYSFSLYLLSLAVGWNTFDWNNIFSDIITVLGLDYWFFSTYLLFCFAIPFLNIWITNMTQKMHGLACLFAFVLTIISFFGAQIVGLDKGFNVIWFIFLFIFASYIKLYDTKKINNYWYLLIYAIATTLTYFLGQSYCSPFVLLSTISIFMIFKNFKIKNLKLSKFINYVSGLTFGIYLLSDNHSFKMFMYLNIFNVNDYYLSKYSYLICFAFVIITFVVCALIEAFRKLIVLLIKKIISKVNNNKALLNTTTNLTLQSDDIEIEKEKNKDLCLEDKK